MNAGAMQGNQGQLQGQSTSHHAYPMGSQIQEGLGYQNATGNATPVSSGMQHMHINQGPQVPNAGPMQSAGQHGNMISGTNQNMPNNLIQPGMRALMYSYQAGGFNQTTGGFGQGQRQAIVVRRGRGGGFT